MLLTERGKKKGKIGNGFTNRQTQTKLLSIYIFHTVVCACVRVCVCVFFFCFYSLTKQFSTQKWEIGPNSKLRPIICIASQETINRNSLFVHQCRLFNKLVNFFFLFARSVISYLCPLATVTLAWVAEYISTFIAIFHKYISFFPAGQ